MAGLAGKILHEGTLLTVTVLVQELVQPCALVTVTVYVVFELGETVIAAVVAPVLHKYVPPPDAVSVALDCPWHMEEVEAEMLHEGTALTVTVRLQELVQPCALVTVTV